MKKNLLLFAAAVISAASCEQVPDSNVINGCTQDNLTAISLRINGETTKALTDNLSETEFNNIQVFLYRILENDEQEYDSYYSFTSDNKDETEHTIYIDLAKKDIKSYKTVIYVNHPKIIPGTVLEDWSYFSNEKTDNFQMTGSSTETVESLKTDPTINISAVRQCSKVTVKKVAVDWTNSANALKEFKITGMYLMDIPGVLKNFHEIDPETASDAKLWQNKMGHTSNTHDAFLYDPITDGAITTEQAYEKSHIFYGYISPIDDYYTTDEWKPSGTRLVIEASFDGKECYYAVKINGADGNAPLTDIRNKHFIFENITITKPGADKPYSVLPEETGITVSVTVERWDEITNSNLVIQ